jgi:hypothetical protein
MTQPSNSGKATQSVVITRAGAQPSSRGSAANFTGSVVVTPLFAATGHTRPGREPRRGRKADPPTSLGVCVSGVGTTWQILVSQVVGL